MSKKSLADKVLNKWFQNELEQILEQHNYKVHSRTKAIPRDCSTKTRHERRNNLRLIFAELHCLGFHLQSPTSLKQKHLHALAEHWQKKGLAAKTLHGLFSNLREFSRWIGKREMVEDISVYCNGREHLIRKTAAATDLSWESCGINVEEFLRKAKSVDERLWVLLCLQRYFGLRVKESLELRPWRATAIGSEHLYISDGTKGGKPRIIPIRNERQRETIDSAKKLVGDRLSAQLRWPYRTWKQAQSHFYYLVGQLGATREQLGVTAHGLRHGYLQDEYEHYARVPAPIKATGLLPPSRIEHQRAMLATSLEAGHYRIEATGMYCGSLKHQLRPKTTPAQSPVTNKNLTDEDDTQ